LFIVLELLTSHDLILFLIAEWICNLLATIERTDENEESAASDDEAERAGGGIPFVVC